MPSRHKTPRHTVQIGEPGDELWKAARAKAAAEGRTMHDVLSDLLRRWLKGK